MTCSNANLNSAFDYDFIQIQPEYGSEDQKLPPEILEMIFSHLSNRDLQKAALVNRQWNEVAIVEANCEATSKLRHFVDFLCRNLNRDLYELQIESLSNLEGTREILISENFIQIKSSMRSCEKNISNILKDLSEDDLNQLEELSKIESKSGFLENIFDLTRNYKKIDGADGKTIGWHKYSDLNEISLNLTNMNRIDEAIEVANMNSDEAYRVINLQNISINLTQKNRIDEAIEVARMIPEDCSKFMALDCMLLHLKSIDQIDAVIEIANTISENHFRDLALLNLPKALAMIDRIDKAIEVADMLSEDSTYGAAILYIVEYLAEKKRIDEANWFASLIPTECAKALAFQAISDALVEIEQEKSVLFTPFSNLINQIFQVLKVFDHQISKC